MMEDRGIPGYRGELDRNCVTAAEALRSSGYHTAMVGKWHLNHIRFEGKKQLNFESVEPFWKDKAGWPLQRGFEEYYGTIHGVCSYYDPFSLVSGNTPVRPETNGFYYTDVISDHAVSSIERHARERDPFFLYVAYTAPHWPLQAPESAIAPLRHRYLEGWDVLRTNRFQRQLKLGVIDKSWPLSPRDPAVASWNEVRDKEWEANRMATYAAMVEQMDRGVGRILDQLHRSGIEQNTMVIFLSDNGACAEVLDPQWYDIPSRTRGGEPIQVGNRDHSVFAGPETVWQSYGASWANVSDTPFLRYKHFTHEGGIATPFIALWPAGIRRAGSISQDLGHVTDIMATLLDVAGVKESRPVGRLAAPALEGRSLTPIFKGQKRRQSAPIFWEHEGNRAVRLGKWKLVAQNRQPWELYNIEADRTELRNLAKAEPRQVEEMSAMYADWAKRCEVVPPDQLPRPTP